MKKETMIALLVAAILVIGVTVGILVTALSDGSSSGMPIGDGSYNIPGYPNVTIPDYPDVTMPEIGDIGDYTINVGDYTVDIGDNIKETTHSVETLTPVESQHYETAAETASEYEHYHYYMSDTMLSPTCTDTGVKVYYCSCGHRYVQDIPANGHSWVAATYSSPKTCRVCGLTEGDPLGYEYAIIGKTNTTTDYVNVRSAPTTNSEIVTSIPPQTRFRIISQTYGYDDGYTWYRAHYNGFEGYVRSDLIDIVS